MPVDLVIICVPEDEALARAIASETSARSWGTTVLVNPSKVHEEGEATLLLWSTAASAQGWVVANVLAMRDDPRAIIAELDGVAGVANFRGTRIVVGDAVDVDARRHLIWSELVSLLDQPVSSFRDFFARRPNTILRLEATAISLVAMLGLMWSVSLSTTVWSDIFARPTPSLVPDFVNVELPAADLQPTTNEAVAFPHAPPAVVTDTPVPSELVADPNPPMESPTSMSPVSASAPVPRDPNAPTYTRALELLAESRTREAVRMLTMLAERGQPLPQYRLAKLYERGEGVQQDLALARLWTGRAAAGGNRRAMHDFGVYLVRGDGGPEDERAAVEWFRRAAELGVADSQFNLGVLYSQGRGGLERSEEEAYYWFAIAAGQGDEDARGRAEDLANSLGLARTEAAQARAAQFRARPASAMANNPY